jgi:hypothetical protein
MPYRYIMRFTDRLGKSRTYFRRGDFRIPLPNNLDSAEFDAAYRNAAAEYEAANPPRQDRPARQPPARPPAEGVYLLLLRGQIIYVGTSAKMPERVATHRRNGREFDKVFYIEADGTERIALEAQLIHRLRPEKNRAGFRYVSYDAEGNGAARPVALVG